MRERTLVTGFGPFGDVTENPSAKLAEGCGRPFRVIEVSFSEVDKFLSDFDADRYARLLMIGVARGRTLIKPELFARNLIGSAPDVHGETRPGPIEPDGPDLVEGTFWTPPILAQSLWGTGLEVSVDAGTYLCNYIYYLALRQFPGVAVGFLHVPSEASIPIDLQRSRLETCLNASEHVETDASKEAGRL